MLKDDQGCKHQRFLQPGTAPRYLPIESHIQEQGLLTMLCLETDTLFLPRHLWTKTQTCTFFATVSAVRVVCVHLSSGLKHVTLQFSHSALTLGTPLPLLQVAGRKLENGPQETWPPTSVPLCNCSSGFILPCVSSVLTLNTTAKPCFLKEHCYSYCPRNLTETFFSSPEQLAP